MGRLYCLNMDCRCRMPWTIRPLYTLATCPDTRGSPQAAACRDGLVDRIHLFELHRHEADRPARPRSHLELLPPLVGDPHWALHRSAAPRSVSQQLAIEQRVYDELPLRPVGL